MGNMGTILQSNRVMEVVMLGFDFSLGLVPTYVLLVLGNEGGGAHHMQGRHTHGRGIYIRKLVVLTLNIHQIFHQGLFLLLFLPMFSNP